MCDFNLKNEFEEVVRSTGKEYAIERGLAGSYRLIEYLKDDLILGVARNYDVIHDDPACVDLYEPDSAMAVFIEIIRERHGL